MPNKLLKVSEEENATLDEKLNTTLATNAIIPSS